MKNIYKFHLLIITLAAIITFNCKENLIDENLVPNLKVISPQNNSTFNKTDKILFKAYLLNDTDTLKYDSLKWESDISGLIGTYNNSIEFLKPGNHKIKCTCYFKNETYSDQVNITVSSTFVLDTIIYNDNFEVYKIPGAKIFALNADNEDNPLIGTDNFGLFYRKNGTWENYNKSDGLFDNSIQTIGIDQSNIIYIGYYWFTGISKKQLDGWQFIPMDKSLGGDVHVIKFDEDNVLWAATHYGNIVKYDNGVWQTFNGIPIYYHHPNELLFDIEKVLWSSSSYGCINFDGKTWKSLSINGSLIRAKSLCIDLNNNVWFGCYDGLYLTNKNDTIKFNSTNSGLPQSTIWALAIDQNNILYIGTDFGLFKYDGQSWNKINLQLEDESIRNLKVNSLNQLWFSCIEEFGYLKKL